MGQLLTEIRILLLDPSHRIRRHLVRSIIVWNVKYMMWWETVV